MERKKIEYTLNIIFEYLNTISYDETIDFKAYKLEIMLNINKFLSPDEYNRNIEILKYADIKESTEQSQYSKYLKKTTVGIIELLQDIYSKEQEIYILEIMKNLTNFLNPAKYEQNKKVLQRNNETNKKRNILTLFS